MLLKVQKLCEMYPEFSPTSVASTITRHRKVFGKNPNYVVMVDGITHIDYDKYLQKTNINDKVFNFLTDPEHGLFWIITYWLGISVNSFSYYCAAKSKQYKSPQSWNLLISTEFWNRNENVINPPNIPMTEELLHHSRELLMEVFRHYKRVPDSNNGKYTHEIDGITINYSLANALSF